MSRTATFAFGRADLLRWLYLGRLAVVTGILAGALLRWLEADPEQTFWATVMFLFAFGFTALEFLHTHVRERFPGDQFLFGHVMLDVLLVTGIIHITGGDESSFAPLYILVIAEGALLLPLAGGVFIAALASVLYFADLFWFHGGTLSGTVLYQIVLFATVALVTGILGDRMRHAGTALGAVESELRQLRLDTGDILNSIGTGVLTVDGTGRLAYLNPAGETLLDLDARQWLGAPVVSRLEEIAPGMGMVLRRSLEEGIPVARFRTTIRRNGREVVLGVSTTVLEREEGGFPSATALFQDISIHERIDALNRRAERLEAVAELSASLAHEIKNPLASIRSAVEQITNPNLDVSDRELLERLVVTESERLSRLLADFLNYSDVTAGPQETVDLREVARSCVVLARQHPDRPEGLEILLGVPDDPQCVDGDPDLLQSAVFNLVLNAVQFSGPHGQVEVEVGRQAQRPLSGAPEVVRLSVRDTGPGVPAEERHRVFDPFYTRRRGGSGLGLAVVHRSIQAHGGAVSVQGAPSGGAEFIVELPAASPVTEEKRA